MDQSSFDRIARLLGGATTRRQGLGAALGGLLGPATVEVASAAAANKGARRGKGNRKPTVEGPCGNGSRKENACSRNQDCCTGLCNLNRANRNRDGKGRCRCVRKGGACTADRNCCNGVTCQSGKCGGGSNPSPAAIPLTGRCGPNDTCADADAVCSVYVDDAGLGTFCLLPNGKTCAADDECIGGYCSSGVCAGKVPTGIACQDGDTCKDPLATCTTYKSGNPVGTYCLLQRNEACTAPADCASGDCVGEVCVSCSCAGCEHRCMPTVCASGCDYTTIQAAIDAASRGAVITLESNTYNEDLTISRDVTLRACPGETATITNTAYQTRAISITGAATVQLVNIIVDGYSDATDTSKTGGGISTNGDIALCGNSALRNNYWAEGGGLRVEGPRDVRITDQTIIEDNDADSYGGGVYLKGRGHLLVNEVATIRNNTTLGWNGGGFATNCGNVTLADHALIDGNSSDSYGGNGAMVCWTGKESYRFVMEGDAVVSNAPVSGLYCYGNVAGGCEIHVEMRDRAKITGHTAITDGGAVYMWEGTWRMSGDTEISGNSSTGAGGAIYLAPPIGKTWLTPAPQFVMEDNAKITGNTSTNNSTNGGGGVYVYGVAMEMRDNAEISGNTGVYGGGGVFIDDEKNPTSLTMNGSSKITGNTATNSSGGGGVYFVNNIGGTLDLTINGSATISGNTPDQCGNLNASSITC